MALVFRFIHVFEHPALDSIHIVGRVLECTPHVAALALLIGAFTYLEALHDPSFVSGEHGTSHEG
jgi:hypothetical protein